MKFQIVNQILSKSFSGGKDFCPNSGDKKMKFYILKLFLNSGERLKIYFSSKKKKFNRNIF